MKSLRNYPPSRVRFFLSSGGLFFGILFVFIVHKYSTEKSVAASALSIPSCLEFGEGFHHRFRSNCQETTHIHGRQISYKINSLGMRERATLPEKKKRVLVLGDSNVEGWGLEFSETLSQQIEMLRPEKVFLNAGIRSSGPLFQASRLEALADRISFDEILLVLSENDAVDDLFFEALAVGDHNGLPESYSSADISRLSFLNLAPRWLSDGNSLFSWVKYTLYSFVVSNYVNAARRLQPDPCRGYNYIQRLAKARALSFYQILVPELPERSAKVIEHIGRFEERLQPCVKGPLIDLRGKLREHQEFYFLDDPHLNPQGMGWLAKEVSAQIGH